jgi:hypothetical protein
VTGYVEALPNVPEKGKQCSSPYHKVILIDQRESYNWDGFNQLLSQFGEVKPRIVNRPGRVRMAFVPGLA